MKVSEEVCYMLYGSLPPVVRFLLIFPLALPRFCFYNNIYVQPQNRIVAV
ncbi:hypothetical protein ABK01_04895 [Treponema sp. OMZ 305]|nr:hypothetical protein ABK01_04895 [Treponema sp. OMZ 305]